MIDPRSSSPVINAKSVERAFRGIRSRGPDLLFRVALVGTFVILARTMLIPLVLGGLCAIVLRPIDDHLKAGLGRAHRISHAVVTLLAVLLFLVPLAWLVWSSISALNGFVTSLLAEGSVAAQARLLSVLSEKLGLDTKDLSLARNLEDALRAVGTWLAQLLGSLAKALPQGITDTFLFVLALYFGLRDGPRLIEWARRVSPVTSVRTEQLFEAVRRSVKGTLLGMLAVALVQSSLAFVALLACSVPHAFLWTFVAAICSAIPIVGTTPVTMGAAVWLFLHDRSLAAVGMLSAAVLIGLSDNVVRPWVQSQHDDVHPLVALVAIFGGLAVFGPSGLLFGPVLASMAVWAVETYHDDVDQQAAALEVPSPHP